MRKEDEWMFPLLGTNISHPQGTALEGTVDVSGGLPMKNGCLMDFLFSPREVEAPSSSVDSPRPGLSIDGPTQCHGLSKEYKGRERWKPFFRGKWSLSPN